VRVRPGGRSNPGTRGRLRGEPATIVLLGETPDPGSLGLPPTTRRFPLPHSVIGPDGRVMVHTLLGILQEVAAQGLELRKRPPVIAVTAHPLATRECASLMGFSDRRRGVAVVSLAGLDADTGPSRSEATQTPGVGVRAGVEPRPGGDSSVSIRVHNLIAHELGHLRGLAHCSTEGCVMNPVRKPHELDHRSPDPCGSCPPLRWWTPWKEIFHSSSARNGPVAEARTP